jgi:hypothetical protein
MAVIQINTDPTRKQLNQFGLIWLVFFAVMGTVFWFKLHSTTVSGAMWAAAVVVPVIGWAVPAFMKLVYLGMSYLAWPIGFVISHIILAVVYYLVFTPIGLIMRLVGYDPMCRRFDAAAESYWVERPKDATMDMRRYFRQF